MNPQLNSILTQLRANPLGIAGAVVGALVLIVGIVLGVLGGTGKLTPAENNTPFEGATEIQLVSDKDVDFTSCTITKGGPAEEKVHRFDSLGKYYANLTPGEHTVTVDCLGTELLSSAQDASGTATFTVPEAGIRKTEIKIS